MARTDNRSQDERKKKRGQRKAQGRTDRHKTRQDLRGRRTGALDKFAAQNQAKVQPAVSTQPAYQEMVNRGTAAGAQIRPPEQAISATPPITDDQKYAVNQPPQVLPAQPVQPQPVAGTAMQPAQVFDGSGQQATPDAVYQQPPQVMPAQPVAPQAQVLPAQPVQPQLSEEFPPAAGQTLPPDQVDPETGEVGPMAEPSIYGEPVTAEEADAQSKMDQAHAQGTPFSFTRPPMEDARQFQAGLAKGGTAAAINPRKLERLRRKRLALLNPKVQQLRPWGRGMPQVRFNEGPAFEGSFPRGGPQVRPAQPQAQPTVRGEGRPQFRRALVR